MRSAQGARDWLSLNPVVSLVNLPPTRRSRSSGPLESVQKLQPDLSVSVDLHPLNVGQGDMLRISIGGRARLHRSCCTGGSCESRPGFRRWSPGGPLGALCVCVDDLLEAAGENRGDKHEQMVSKLASSHSLAFRSDGSAISHGSSLPDGISRRSSTASPSSNSQSAAACTRPACSSPVRAWCRRRGGRTWPNDISPRALPLSWTWTRTWTTWVSYAARWAGGAVKTVSRRKQGDRISC